MNNFRKFSVALCLSLVALTSNAESVEVKSPAGNIKVELNVGKDMHYIVYKNDRHLFDVTNLSITVDGRVYGTSIKKAKVTCRSESETVRPVVPMKFSSIKYNYNEVSVGMPGKVSLQLRVSDEGVSHRFVIAGKGKVEIGNETMSFVPEGNPMCHVQQPGSFNTSYEDSYKHKTFGEWKQEDKLATLPVLFSGEGDCQLLVGESDVDDYPRMFLRGSSEGASASFPKVPAQWEPQGDRGEKILKEENFIAKTSGSRTLPWRWTVVTDSKGLLEQTMPVVLSRKSALKDVSWIQPGQVCWEWWNGAVPFGPEVDFKAGNNYDTYKYYLDFAAKYGVKYILLDEGWAKSTRDPFTEKPGLELQRLIQYGKSKGVDIFLWLSWLTVEQHMDLFKKYSDWGVAGVKIDFMDHSDQWMVNFYKRVVQEAAKYKLLVDFHGSFTPSGLEHEYPNLISYEGVRGMEQMGGCRPDNSIYFPFMRNAVGAMDYTPGAMNDYQPDQYRAERPNAGSIGTRVYQMALYVVFESGVQMLADNPSLYYRNDDCTRFITSVPTTWDETRCLAAEVGKYVVVAKRKGNKWFVGGICNGEGSRTIHLDLNFLAGGRTYHMKAFKDGMNADYQAMDYRVDSVDVTSRSSVDVQMVKNGGWAAVIE